MTDDNGKTVTANVLCIEFIARDREGQIKDHIRIYSDGQGNNIEEVLVKDGDNNR